MIDRILKFGSKRAYLRASFLGALIGGGVWLIVSGDPWWGLAGVVFGIPFGPLVQWSEQARNRREASKPGGPSPPPAEPTAEEKAILDDYLTSSANRWRRWVGWILPPAGAAAGLIAALVLEGGGNLRILGAGIGLALGIYVVRRWFSAGAYLRSKNPSGRPRY